MKYKTITHTAWVFDKHVNIENWLNANKEIGWFLVSVVRPQDNLVWIFEKDESSKSENEFSNWSNFWIK